MVNVNENHAETDFIEQPILPPKARPSKILNIKEKLTFQKKIELHPVFLASKKDKPEGKNNLYFFKLNSKNTAITQLEAYCGAISRLIAPNYVPSLSIYYDEENCFIGVASKAWANYKANADDPLTFDDIELGNTDLDIICQKNWLQRLVGKAIQHNEKLTTNISNYFDLNFLSSLWSQEPNIIVALKKFYKTELIAHADVDALFVEVTKRCDILKNKKELTSIEKDEWQILYEILGSIDKLFDMQNSKYQSVNLRDIITFEENLSSHEDLLGVNILDESQHQHFQCLKGLAIALMTRYLFKEGDNHNCNIDKNGRLVDFNMTKLNILFDHKEHNIFDLLLRRPESNTFVCSAYDIEHFPDIKDANFYFWPTKQTEVLPILIDAFTKFLDQCANFTQDDENDIQQKLLRVITDVMVLFNVSDNILLDRLSRSLFAVVLNIKAFFLNVPVEELADTERRKYVFSLLRDNFITFVNRYQDSFEFLEKKAHEFFGPKHYYNDNDNKVFQKLAGHPVFIYYKYRTLLKYLLTDATLYQSLATLYFSSDQKNPDSTKSSEIINKLTIDEQLRLQEISNIVVNMPNFKTFLNEYGDLAMQGILREFNQYKEKYSAKIPEKPYYKDIVTHIDTHAFNKRYIEICKLSGATIAPISDGEYSRISL